VLFFVSTALSFSVVRQSNIEQLTINADRVFLGKCMAARVGLDDHRLPACFYAFEILKSLKGSLPHELKIKQFGGSGYSQDQSMLRFDGMPEYKVGNTYLLFLGPDSNLGFTSPQGLAQGSFLVFTDPASSRLAAENGNRNRGLFLSLKQDAWRGARPYALREGDPDGPVFLDDLMAYIVQLIKK
jgi:hypothetical protein